MQEAIEKMRSGDPFPRELALELPYSVLITNETQPPPGATSTPSG